MDQNDPVRTGSEGGGPVITTDPERSSRGAAASVVPSFLAELTRAMQAAAAQQREEIATVVKDDAAAQVDLARKRGAAEAGELRKLADQDVRGSTPGRPPRRSGSVARPASGRTSAGRSSRRTSPSTSRSSRARSTASASPSGTIARPSTTSSISSAERTIRPSSPALPARSRRHPTWKRSGGSPGRTPWRSSRTLRRTPPTMRATKMPASDPRGRGPKRPPGRRPRPPGRRPMRQAMTSPGSASWTSMRTGGPRICPSRKAWRLRPNAKLRQPGSCDRSRRGRWRTVIPRTTTHRVPDSTWSSSHPGTRRADSRADRRAQTIEPCVNPGR